MTPEEEYAQLMKSRAALQSELDSGGIVDESGEMPESAGATDVMKANAEQQQLAALQGQQKSGALEKAGALTTGAGVVGGNPVVGGVGLGLSALGAVDSAVRASNQSKIDAYNKKIMAQRSAARNFFA